MTRKNYLRILISVFFLCFAFLASALAAEDIYLIKAKKIYTVTNGVIENGMILIKNGKISRIGKDFPIPESVKKIQANIVIPGLIDIHTHLGVYSLPLGDITETCV